MTRKLILDLDVGIDDTLALTYALGSPDAELIGVMTSFGNVTVGMSATNALAVLDLLGHPEVPVFVGADRPLVASEPFAPTPAVVRIHGENGVGECQIPQSAREPVCAETPSVAGGTAAGFGPAPSNAAVEFLLDSAERYGDELVYVPTGPLTNLALALKRDAGLVRGLRHVTLMGGALTVPGNVSPAAEANIANDPEAADLVFRSGLRTTMVGLDVTHQTLLTKRETARWRALASSDESSKVRAAAEFLANMTDYYIDIYLENNPYLGGCSLHDPLAVGVALDPSLVGTHAINLKVDLAGAFRGRTIGDDECLNDPHKTCDVALTVAASRFLGEFMMHVGQTLAAL